MSLFILFEKGKTILKIQYPRPHPKLVIVGEIFGAEDGESSQAKQR